MSYGFFFFKYNFDNGIADYQDSVGSPVNGGSSISNLRKRAYKGFKDPDLIKFPCFADTTERGDRGAKAEEIGGEREGDFMDNSNVKTFSLCKR
jgi:hypothetical protein